MTRHLEHIDNKRKRSEGIIGMILVNNQEIPIYFFAKIILSINNKMLSYQAPVEFDFNQESGDFDLSETAEVIPKVPVKVQFSRNQTHSTQNQRLLTWTSHWQMTIGSPNAAEKYKRPNRGTRLCKRDLIILKVWTLGKRS